MPLQKDVFQECSMSQIYCDDYICSERKEKVRDSFSQTMKPGKGNSVYRNPRTSEASPVWGWDNHGVILTLECK